MLVQCSGGQAARPKRRGREKKGADDLDRVYVHGMPYMSAPHVFVGTLCLFGGDIGVFFFHISSRLILLCKLANVMHAHDVILEAGQLTPTPIRAEMLFFFLSACMFAYREDGDPLFLLLFFIPCQSGETEDGEKKVRVHEQPKRSPNGPPTGYPRTPPPLLPPPPLPPRAVCPETGF